MIWFFKKKDNLVAKPMDEARSKKGWFTRLKDQLAQSSKKITEGVTQIFTTKRLDETTLTELEELLISADLGPATAAKLVEGIRKDRFGKEVTAEEIRGALGEEIEKILTPAEKPLFGIYAKPYVILVAGVNGTGKTTTIGKLAAQFKNEGRKVMMVAGDTFRAAAVEQLKVWASRVNCPVVAAGEGA